MNSYDEYIEPLGVPYITIRNIVVERLGYDNNTPISGITLEEILETAHVISGGVFPSILVTASGCLKWEDHEAMGLASEYVKKTIVDIIDGEVITRDTCLQWWHNRTLDQQGDEEIHGIMDMFMLLIEKVNEFYKK